MSELNYDHEADWAEVVTFVQGVVDGAGKTRAGQEARPGAIRARREYVVEDVDAGDTLLQRRTPSSEWTWNLSLLFKYPGRGAAGSLAAALTDLQPVAGALTTSNPKRGWRLTVGRLRARVQGNDIICRLQVVVEHVYWNTGAIVGQDAASVETEQQERT